MVEWSFDTRDAQAARDTRLDFVRCVDRFYGEQADATLAEVVLGELISNVVRYAPGLAHVQADFDERGVTIAVQDSGNGFSPSPLERESHLLAESGRGLAIVSRLAGTIEVVCAGNDGCCVRTRLDVRRSEAGSERR